MGLKFSQNLIAILAKLLSMSKAETERRIPNLFSCIDYENDLQKIIDAIYNELKKYFKA